MNRTLCSGRSSIRLFPASLTCNTSQFAAARSIVQQGPVDLLVTNLRLGAFNGLHLVHLAAALTIQSRAIVYTDQLEIGLGREIQRAGAFYDTRLRLPHTLASYVRAALPSQDRRHLAVNDRRQAFRGGRRSADRPQSDGLTGNGARITGRVR